MSELTKNDFLYLLFQLESCLAKKTTKNLVSYLQQILKIAPETKIPFSLNPGLTLYTPSSPKNLSSKKTALIFSHELSRTGAPVVATDAAKILAKSGFFTLVVTMRRGPLLKELLECGIPVIFDQELSSINNYARLMDFQNDNFYIDTLSSAFNSTIVVTVVYYNLIRHFSNLKKPVIWWVHEGDHSYKIFGPHMPRELPPTTRVYAGGAYAKKQLENYGFAYNPKILNYGVTDVFTPSAQLEPPKTKIKFLLPGSLTYRKGQRVLLNAIKKLPKNYRDQSEFLFIGDITSNYDTDGLDIKNEIVTAAKTFPFIEYIPSVSRDQLFKIYQDIDILTLASLDDPMPVVATEALMFEKVVLCSTETGTSYYLKDGENGFVFPSNDSSALCEKIMFIIDHKTSLDAIGKKGRAVYRKYFEMGVFEEKLLRIIGETK